MLKHNPNPGTSSLSLPPHKQVTGLISEDDIIVWLNTVKACEGSKPFLEHGTTITLGS